MITAIVTLYNPTKDHVDNLNAFSRQVDRVFACDNSKADNSFMFADCPQSISYIPFLENRGLSKAFNHVLKNGKWSGEDDWIIFFDQDSNIKDGHVAKLIDEYDAIRKQGIDIGCIGPVYHDSSSGHLEVPKKKKRINTDSFIVSSIITSSLLTTYNVLEKIDFWNEEVFLDMADWDLCWRLVNSGFKCVITYKSVLNHSVGIGKKTIGPFNFRVGMPIREYYQNREALLLIRKKYTPLKYKVRLIEILTIRNLIHITCFDNRKERFFYIKSGIWDHFKNRQGEFEP